MQRLHWTRISVSYLSAMAMSSQVRVYLVFVPSSQSHGLSGWIHDPTLNTPLFLLHGQPGWSVQCPPGTGTASYGDLPIPTGLSVGMYIGTPVTESPCPWHWNLEWLLATLPPSGNCCLTETNTEKEETRDRDRERPHVNDSTGAPRSFKIFLWTLVMCTNHWTYFQLSQLEL
jgi:hypothetical protein